MNVPDVHISVCFNKAIKRDLVLQEEVLAESLVPGFFSK